MTVDDAGRVAPQETLTGDESLVLPEFDEPPADPVGLLRQWLKLAEQHDVREPGAAVLATADAGGEPSSRVVLLKESTAGGLVFTSHDGSRKGRDLAGNPRASVTLYWRETLQQLTVAGSVLVLDDVRSDALFADRPAAAQATTAVSRLHRRLEYRLRDGVWTWTWTWTRRQP